LDFFDFLQARTSSERLEEKNKKNVTIYSNNRICDENLGSQTHRNTNFAFWEDMSKIREKKASSGSKLSPKLAVRKLRKI